MNECDARAAGMIDDEYKKYAFMSDKVNEKEIKRMAAYKKVTALMKDESAYKKITEMMHGGKTKSLDMADIYDTEIDMNAYIRYRNKDNPTLNDDMESNDEISDKSDSEYLDEGSTKDSVFTADDASPMLKEYGISDLTNRTHRKALQGLELVPIVQFDKKGRIKIDDVEIPKLGIQYDEYGNWCRPPHAVVDLIEEMKKGYINDDCSSKVIPTAKQDPDNELQRAKLLSLDTFFNRNEATLLSITND